MRKIGLGCMLIGFALLALMIAFMGYLSNFDARLYATMTAVYRK